MLVLRRFNAFGSGNTGKGQSVRRVMVRRVVGGVFVVERGIASRQWTGVSLWSTGYLLMGNGCIVVMCLFRG